mgnify:CR=1 FL=1|jgi:hypothetical protein
MLDSLTMSWWYVFTLGCQVRPSGDGLNLLTHPRIPTSCLGQLVLSFLFSRVYVAISYPLPFQAIVLLTFLTGNGLPLCFSQHYHHILRYGVRSCL